VFFISVYKETTISSHMKWDYAIDEVICPTLVLHIHKTEHILFTNTYESQRMFGCFNAANLTKKIMNFINPSLLVDLVLALEL
jgi:hypothetical protein